MEETRANRGDEGRKGPRNGDINKTMMISTKIIFDELG